MGQGLFPAQPTGVWDAGIMGTLGFGKKGKSHFGVAQVPARAAFRVWQGRSCSGGMGLAYKGMSGHSTTWQVMLAR